MADSAAIRFEEAIAYLRLRVGLTPAEWNALLESAGVAAARIAEDQTQSMVRDLLGAVLEAIETGGTYDTFRDRYAEIVAEHGWSYNGNAGWHSRLIFRQNTANAYMAGRWEQIQRQVETRPNTRFYLRYVTVGDERVRHQHREWHGIILPVDHWFWRTHYPPNGFNCRCRVQLLTERDISRRGWRITPQDDPRLGVPPDTGFNNNVGTLITAVRSRAPT